MRESLMGSPFMGMANGENWTPLFDSDSDHLEHPRTRVSPWKREKHRTALGKELGVYLYLVVRWWNRTRTSSLASSFPGQEWFPFPNGMKVFGFGATCSNKQRLCQMSREILILILRCRLLSALRERERER